MENVIVFHKVLFLLVYNEFIVILFLRKYLFVWKAQRQEETERCIFHLLICSSNTRNSWSWARLSQDPGTPSGSCLLVAGIQVFQPSVLPPSAYNSRRLDQKCSSQDRTSTPVSDVAVPGSDLTCVLTFHCEFTINTHFKVFSVKSISSNCRERNLPPSSLFSRLLQ